MATKRSPRPGDTRPVEDFPEVVSFIEAQTELDTFIDEHKDIYEEICRLAIERNTRLEEADKVVRAAKVSVGPFNKLSESKKINPEKLYEELGEADFVKVGGYTETVREYKVDKKRFMALVEADQIPREVVSAVINESTSYTVIPKYVLP
jgi:hypothetical protein